MSLLLQWTFLDKNWRMGIMRANPMMFMKELRCPRKVPTYYISTLISMTRM